MFVRTSMGSEGQDATKITSALADWRIYSFVKMMTLYMCIVAITIFLCVSPSFSPSVAMSTSRPAGVCRSNRWAKNSAEQAERLESYCYESLAFSRRSVDLEFNEEVMKPERFTEAPDHTGFNPDNMRVSKQKTTHNGDVSHFSSFFRTSDTCFETHLTSEREPIEEDEERLAMKIGDMPPPLPWRVSNPRIRDDQALNGFFSSSDKMHRPKSDDVYTKAWLDYSRPSFFPQSGRKVGEDVNFFNVSTYQCSILVNKLGSFNRKSEFWKRENQNKPITRGEKLMSMINRYSRNLGETIVLMFLDGRGRQFADRHKAVALKTMAWWDSIQP